MAITELAITPIDVGQCEAVWPLSIEAGWNQNVADWRFMLGAGHGFGLRNAAGQWEASSLVLPLGRKLAWISMVLVTRARRRGGVGSGLLKRCIAEVTASGAVAGLDATEQGRPIYLPLGFRDLYRILRWHLDAATEAPSAVAVRPLAPSDLPALLAYDRALSGMERPALLTHLAGRAGCRQPARLCADDARPRAGPRRSPPCLRPRRAGTGINCRHAMERPSRTGSRAAPPGCRHPRASAGAGSRPAIRPRLA